MRLMIFLLALPPVQAAVINWTGPASESWHAGVNWNPTQPYGGPGMAQGQPSGNTVNIGAGNDVYIAQPGIPVWVPGGDFVNLSAGSRIIVAVGTGNPVGLAVITQLNNAGEIVLGGSFGGGHLWTGPGPTYPLAIDGGGKITLSDSPGNAVTFSGYGNTTQPLNLVNQTIQGAGRVGGFDMTVSSLSVIDGNSTYSPLYLTGNIANSGLLRASNAGTLQLGISGDTGIQVINTPGGVIQADNGSTVLLSQGSITGGTLSTQGTGQFIKSVAGTFDLSNLTLAGSLNVAGGAWLGTKGSIHNTGTLTLEGSGGQSRLYLNGGTSLSGGGTLTFAAGGDNRVLDGTLTNLDNLIQGNVSAEVNIVNFGTLQARAGDSFSLPFGGSLNNQGTVRVDGGGGFWIAYNAGFANYAGGTLTGGTFDIAGTLGIGDPPRLIMTNASNLILDGPGSRIILQQGGGADALSTFSNNAAAGRFTIKNGRNFTSAGNFTNAGVVNIGAGSTFNTGPAGTAAYTQSAGGQTILNGALYAGTLNAQGSLSGAGELHAALLLQGQLNPGNSPGTLTVFGDYTQTAASILYIEAGMGTADQLLVNGNVNLAGTLSVIPWGAWNGPADYLFDILHWTGVVNGSFDQINLPALPGYTFATQWGDHDLWLRATGGEPGGGGGDVPEPATFYLIGAALLAGSCRFWRRS